MRKILTKTAILLACVSLVGCASNTQGQNTGIGAVTGAAVGGLVGGLAGGGGVGIGVGILAGALAGGLIGHSMDSSDNTAMATSLNNNRPNRATTWTNPKTGVTYKFVPTTGMININGNPNCRKYYTTAIVNGKKQKIHGAACRQSDGSWKGVA